MSKKSGEVRVEIVKSSIQKSDSSEQLKRDEEVSSYEWITPAHSLKNLEQMVEHSSILPQCINAYKSNIAGFGIGVRYKNDVTDTKKLEDEFNRMSEIIELLTVECDTKEIFEKIIGARETYGIAYLEVIRNLMGDVVQIEFIENTPSMEKSIESDKAFEVEYNFNGKIHKRKKKFRRYRQTVNGKTVYFKEFGDKRIMDKTTGEYVNKLEESERANEILEFKIGEKPYGQVRWIGQTLSIDGSRKAENLNNNYFENGRHTPMAVIVSNGTLTDESFDKLKADNVK